ncbi:MAG: hypothetical protein PHF37_00275 [Phycisphaerae bacterium]|nr:hypothetical protein [Phycisphaerae bacterium]
MKSSAFPKLGTLLVFVFACFAFAAHPQTARMQRQALQDKSNRLNMPAENESRQQRVRRQLMRNEVRSDLARVENQIATSQPSPSERAAQLGRNRSNTRIKANQFVTNSSRGFSRGNAFTNNERTGFRRDDDSARHREVSGAYFRSYQHDLRSQNHSPRIFDSGTRHNSFTSSRFRNPQIFNSVAHPYKHKTIYYRYGRRHTFSRIYPYYHKKYIFVSLNGLWPSYTYVRYYTYGCYPYYWYGYYPTTYVIGGGYENLYSYDSGISSVDATAYSDVQKQFNEDEEVLEETAADTYFDAAVAAFADEQYEIAEKNIAKAMSTAPDDIVLPYAMIQSLFAQAKYTGAAEVLRKAVENTPTNQEGVIFARGLYADQDKLYNKIDELADEAGRNYYDDDLHLLLGYQYLGIGQYNDAERHLEKARINRTNGKAAVKLIEVLEDLRSSD